MSMRDRIGRAGVGAGAAAHAGRVLEAGVEAGGDVRVEAAAGRRQGERALDLVAGPDATISRYFFGTHVESRDLRLALVQASGGEVGTLPDRIALVCSHFDPVTGRYTGAALMFMRAGAILTLALLAAIVIRAKRRAGRRT